MPFTDPNAWEGMLSFFGSAFVSVYKFILGPARDVFVGLMGGLVFYGFGLYRAYNNNQRVRFRFWMMAMAGCFGAFMSWIVGSGLDHDVPLRDLLLGFVGIAAYNIIALVEERFAEKFVGTALED